MFASSSKKMLADYSAEPAIAATLLATLDATGLAVVRRNNVRVVGEGKPPLLLCNGFGCSQHIWRYLILGLAKHHQLVLFDHVGTGDADLSAYDAQKYSTLAGYAQDVVEICQVLALQNVIIVGHSIGATIATRAAVTAPAYFSKAILLAASPYFLNEPGYYGGFERGDMEQVLALMQTDYRSWANVFTSLLVDPLHEASLGEELIGYFCTMDSTIAQQFAQIAFLSDNRADVPRLRIPTLLVQCAEDVAAPAEVGSYLLRHLPQATLVTLPVAGHCPHLSAPLETLTAIQTFLALS